MSKKSPASPTLQEQVSPMVAIGAVSKCTKEATAIINEARPLLDGPGKKLANSAYNTAYGLIQEIRTFLGDQCPLSVDIELNEQGALDKQTRDGLMRVLHRRSEFFRELVKNTPYWQRQVDKIRSQYLSATQAAKSV